MNVQPTGTTPPQTPTSTQRKNVSNNTTVNEGDLKPSASSVHSVSHISLNEVNMESKGDVDSRQLEANAVSNGRGADQ